MLFSTTFIIIEHLPGFVVRLDYIMYSTGCMFLQSIHETFYDNDPAYGRYKGLAHENTVCAA